MPLTRRVTGALRLPHLPRGIYFRSRIFLFPVTVGTLLLILRQTVGRELSVERPPICKLSIRVKSLTTLSHYMYYIALKSKSEQAEPVYYYQGSAGSFLLFLSLGPPLASAVCITVAAHGSLVPYELARLN